MTLRSNTQLLLYLYHVIFLLLILSLRAAFELLATPNQVFFAVDRLCSDRDRHYRYFFRS